MADTGFRGRGRGGGGGGGKSAKAKTLQGAADLAGTFLGNRIGNSALARKASVAAAEWASSEKVEGLVQGVAAIVNGHTTAPRKAVDAAKKMFGLTDSEAVEVVDDLTTDLILSLASQFATNARNPAAVYDAVEREVNHASEIDKKRREGHDPYQVVNYLSGDHMLHYKNWLRSLKEEEKKKLQERAADIAIKPETISGVIRLYAPNQEQMTAALFPLFGITDKPKEKPKPPFDGALKALERVGEAVRAVTGSGAATASLPPKTDAELKKEYLPHVVGLRKLYPAATVFDVELSMIELRRIAYERTMGLGTLMKQWFELEKAYPTSDFQTDWNEIVRIVTEENVTLKDAYARILRGRGASGGTP